MENRDPNERIYIYYCVPCEKVLSGEVGLADEHLKCPSCGRRAVPTGIVKSEWLQMDEEDKNKVLSEAEKKYDPAAEEDKEKSWVPVFLIIVGIIGMILSLFSDQPILCGIGSAGLVGFGGLLQLLEKGLRYYRRYHEKA